MDRLTTWAMQQHGAKLMRRIRGVWAAALVLGLAACAGNARVDPGPDEFSVLPKAALADPAGGAPLPAPGGVSIAEPNPFAMANSALGGGGGATGPQNGAGALSVPRRGGFLSRLFGGGKRGAMALDPAAEAARLRQLGIPTLGGN